MTDLLTENAPNTRKEVMPDDEPNLPHARPDTSPGVTAGAPTPDAPNPLPTNCREWFYYPIEMPLSADGQGPATVGVDAAKITYEVWDVLLNTYSSHGNLPDAINEAMRLNLMDAPAPDALRAIAGGQP